MNIVLGIIVGIILGEIGAVGGTLYGITKSNVIGSQTGYNEDFIEETSAIIYHVKTDNCRSSHSR